MSVRNDDKEHIVTVARKMQSAGLHLIGTRGTAIFLSNKGIKMDIINKMSEGGQNIVDLVHKRK